MLKDLLFCGRTDKVKLFIMFLNHISRSEAGGSSVDFMFRLVQSHLCWFQHVPVPFLVAQTLAYRWSAHHCKSAHQVLSVSPSKAGHQQTAAWKLPLCYVCRRLLFKMLHTPQKLESLLNSHPTCWSFSLFAGTKGHIFTSKIEAGTWNHLSGEWFKQTRLPHTRWPSLPLCFCQAPAPTRSLFFIFFEADVNCRFSTIVLIVCPDWIKTQMSGLRGLSLQTHKNASLF